MDISKMDKAEVLATLFNNSRPLGMGMLHYKNRNMNVDEAREILKTQTDFDYLEGRVMKIDLSGNELRTGLYNRDNGENAAEKALAVLSKKRLGRISGACFRLIRLVIHCGGRNENIK